MKKPVIDDSKVSDSNSATKIVNEPTTLITGTSTSNTSYHDDVNDSDTQVSRATDNSKSINAINKRVRALEILNTSLKHEVYSWKAKYRLCERLKQDCDESHFDLTTKLEEEIVSLKNK